MSCSTGRTRRDGSPSGAPPASTTEGAGLEQRRRGPAALEPLADDAVDLGLVSPHPHLKYLAETRRQR
jgi:hypothetical protein